MLRKSLSSIITLSLVLAAFSAAFIPSEAEAGSYDYVLYKYRGPSQTPEPFKRADLGREIAEDYRGSSVSSQDKVKGRYIPSWLSNEPLPKNNIRDIQNSYTPSAFDRAEYGRWLSSNYRGSYRSALRVHGSRPEREDFKKEIPQPRTSSNRYNLGKRVRFTSEAGWDF